MLKIDERTARPAQKKVLSKQFSDDEATRQMVLHLLKRVLAQYKEEIQKLAYK